MTLSRGAGARPENSLMLIPLPVEEVGNVQTIELPEIRPVTLWVERSAVWFWFPAPRSKLYVFSWSSMQVIVPAAVLLNRETIRLLPEATLAPAGIVTVRVLKKPVPWI